ACGCAGRVGGETVEWGGCGVLAVLVIPFPSCSARVPIYALLIGGFVPAVSLIPGLVGLQGLVFTGVYVFGITNALIAAAVLDRLTRKRMGGGRLADAPFVVELPPYRVPSVKP